MASLFPDKILNPENNLNLELIASKLTYYQIQIQLIHWQTTSYAQHKALGDLYEFIAEFKDDVVEKLMGYLNKRVQAFKIDPIVNSNNASALLNEMESFAYTLCEWGNKNHYGDIENRAQEFSGIIAKTKYLLTLI